MNAWLNHLSWLRKFAHVLVEIQYYHKLHSFYNKASIVFKEITNNLHHFLPRKFNILVCGLDFVGSYETYSSYTLIYV